MKESWVYQRFRQQWFPSRVWPLSFDGSDLHFGAPLKRIATGRVAAGLENVLPTDILRLRVANRTARPNKASNTDKDPLLAWQPRRKDVKLELRGLRQLRRVDIEVNDFPSHDVPCGNGFDGLDDPDAYGGRTHQDRVES
jgi:hypothetical protein